MTSPSCCPKCIGTIKNHSTETMDECCENTSCPCHVLPIAPTNTKDWEKVLELVGEASMCWDNTGSAIFDEKKAIKVGEKLYALLAEARKEGYAEGVRDEGTKTKNGVQRYQIGYEDGRKEQREEDAKKVEDKRPILWNNDPFKHQKNIGAYEALTHAANAIRSV